ncbi:MAG: hypothetical protein RBR32_06740 [Bacteroidales bacterium]|nr:hypothetical protein [Bacteroidales bacterium]
MSEKFLYGFQCSKCKEVGQFVIQDHEPDLSKAMPCKYKRCIGFPMKIYKVPNYKDKIKKKEMNID